jgi:hypothetical protein
MPKTPKQLVAACLTQAICNEDDIHREKKIRMARINWIDTAAMEELPTTYLVAALERGKGGLLHVQAYIELSRKIRFDRLKKMLPPGCHIEKRYGTGLQASNYCKKGEQTHAEWELDGIDGKHFGDKVDIIIEYGELKSVSRGKRNDIEMVRDAIMRDGSITNEVDLALTVSSYQAWQLGKDLLRLAPVSAMRSPPVVYWLHGSTGSGKSYAAAKLCERLKNVRNWQYWQSTGDLHWFDGYCRQEVAWFDDFRFEGRRSDFAIVLKLFDRYTHRVPIKGGFTIWCPRVIIITAPQPASESFGTVSFSEDLAQLGRRITESFHFQTIEDGKKHQERLMENILQYTKDMEPKTGLPIIDVEKESI